MFPWFKNLRASNPHWKDARYPAAELDWLRQDFEALEPLSIGICDSIMQFISTGDDEEMLQTLAGMRAASGGLSLRCRTNGQRATPHRERFFEATTILDPAFHLRLAMIYEAASNSQGLSGRGRPTLALGLQGGGEFLFIYLWELLRVDANVYPRRPKPCRLTALELEKMLELGGCLPSWLVRGALVVDPDTWGWNTTAGALIPSVPGFREALVRHASMVRECLGQPDHRAKIHAIGVLWKAEYDPVHCPDLAARLATATAKGLREAAEGWISLNPGPVLHHLRKLAADGTPTERFQAVKLLARIGGKEALAFLAKRLPSEGAPKVAELIQGCLNPQSKLDLAAEGLPSELPPLPALPDLTNIPPLAPALLDEVRDVIRRANAEWLALWEKTKSQRWSPPEPTQFPPGTAEEWFGLLETLDAGIHPQHKAVGRNVHPTPALIEFAGHPQLGLAHVLRWAALLHRDIFTKGRSWFGPAIQCFDARIRDQGPIDFRELAAICQRLRFDTTWIARLWFSANRHHSSEFAAQSGDSVWPYFAERLSLIEQALGWLPAAGDFVPKYQEPEYRANAWRALTTFPVPPPSLLDRMWETALGTSKTERPLAQQALLRAPNLAGRLVAALSSGQQAQRIAAADWLGRLNLATAIPALREAVGREKSDWVKAVMIGALERLGVPPEEFLDRGALARDACKTSAKGAPAAMAWFPLAQLPVVHWADTGAVVEPEVLHAWLIQACKLKESQPNALVRRYAAAIVPQERETLGRFILEAWLAEDVMPNPREEAERLAMASARQTYQSTQQYPQIFQAYVGFTVEQLFAQDLPYFLDLPRGSAIASKGILAVAGACVGGDAVPAVARYLKKWYGTRVHQARALLQMLAAVDHPAAAQTLLAIGTRFRTKSLQQEAVTLAGLIAERKGWSLAELADRTIPTAGLDDAGILTLSFGPRQFAATLDAELKLVLRDPDGKPLKTLPDPRKEDNAELAADAKKQLASARKELKQVLDQQRINLHEAMCVQRSWRAEDWEPFLCRHPIVRHYCQHLVWTAQGGDKIIHFRPLADGSYTDVQDNPVTLDPTDFITLAHQSTVPAETAQAWLRHLGDYEIAPLFEQFGGSLPALTKESGELREMKDFEGWMTDTFKLRGRATKLSYVRGQAEDGGWFFEYVRRFPTTGLAAIIEFTGSALPETNVPAALTRLVFRNEDGTHRSRELPLAEIPPVLLAECWNDWRKLAADGSGFDPEWEAKSAL